MYFVLKSLKLYLHYSERNNVNKILRILKQSTSSWRFYSSYHNDVRNHEPEIYIRVRFMKHDLP